MLSVVVFAEEMSRLSSSAIWATSSMFWTAPFLVCFRLIVIFWVADGVVGLLIGAFYHLYPSDGLVARLDGVTAAVAGLVDFVSEPRRMSDDSRRGVHSTAGVVLVNRILVNVVVDTMAWPIVSLHGLLDGS